MTMAMLDLAVKLPMPEAMPGAPDVATGEGAADLFGELLQQLAGDSGKQGRGEPETTACDGAPPEVQAAVPSSNAALALPMPQLQAALAAALAGMSGHHGCADADETAAVADADRDLLVLSRLVARKVAEANPDRTVSLSDDGPDFPGAVPALQAWLNGPYTAAAVDTGAAQKRPMNLAVLGVATHFAPVIAPSDSALVADAEDTAAMTVRSVPLAAERIDGQAVGRSSDDAMPLPTGPSRGEAVSATAMPMADGDASRHGPHDGGDGSRDPEPSSVEPQDHEAPNVTLARVGDMSPGAAASGVARQIGDEVERVLAGDGPRPTDRHSDARPAAGKLKVLHIQLQPDSLGTVTVRMEIKGDVLDLRIDAARAETADLIQRDREVLSSLIRGTGYSADDASIRVTHGDPAIAATVAASVSDGPSSGSGQGSPSAGDRSGQPNGREGGERRGEQRGSSSGHGGPHDGPAGRDERDLYL